MRVENVQQNSALQRSFALYDQEVTINNIQLGCILGMLLMPAGVVLDWFMYPEQVGDFFKLRLLCAGLIGVFWGVVRSSFGRKYHRAFGVLLAMFPAFFITLMIAMTNGGNSPYYAGLNLVLLVVGYILHWTVLESLIACGAVFLMYLAACFWNPIPLERGPFFNNLYFLILTGIIVIAGSYHHSKLRFNEFALRFELDKNRGELEENNRKLKEMDEVKSRFFANISHELRTPLTLLLAPLESIMARGRGGFDPETAELLATMQGNGMRLLKLINDLLDLVRLDAGKVAVRKEPLDVEAFLKGLIQSVKKVAEDKKLNIVATVQEGVGAVLADRDKWEKILLNLLFNAIKFTPSRGRIELIAQRQENLLVLQVKDTGMGISREHLANVFGRFWQADTSAQRKFQGAGIGLALVKELVDVQQGTVRIESEVQKGTTITIELPYEAAPLKVIDGAEAASNASTAAPETEEWIATLYRRAELFPAVTLVQDSMRPVELPGRNRGHTVLIADDEPDMLRFLKSQLSSRFQVIEAVDGLEAEQKAAQFLPDLVLLDMMMPEKDGLQVCRELKARTSTARIPVVLLTARADEETKLAALAAGASDFLPKPFSTTELHVRIKNLLQSHEYQRKLARQNQILESTIQQLKETELQLVQSEKLASLGRMSAGIIHEINNPLNFARTAVHLIKKQGGKLPAEEQEEFQEMLRDIGEGIDRVRVIVTDLRSFTHPNTENFEEVAINHVITSALRFLSHEWKDKVEIRQEFDENQKVWGNRHQLVQVVLNLLQNALDSLKKAESAGKKSVISIIGTIEDGRFLLKIRDNGPGIAPETISRIFDPFFTTKDVGEGMGLGLSICYKIMETHEGRITVQSENGEFCQFTLEFPAPVREIAV